MSQFENRTELIVSIFAIKQAKTLQKYGDIRFISTKMHYVILFVDSKKITETIKEIKKQHFVKKVEISQTPTLAVDFSELNQNVEEEG